MASNTVRPERTIGGSKHDRTNNSVLVVSVVTDVTSPPREVQQSSVADLALVLSNSHTEVCRICLQQTGQMISPCRCRGSIEYVHEGCLREWISKSLTTDIKWNSSTSAEIKCEMCHTSIPFSVRKKYFCRKKSLKEVFEKDARNIVVKIVILLFLFGASLFLSVVSYQSFNANSQQGALSVNLGLAVVSAVLVIVLLTLFAWLLAVFIRDYLVRTVTEIYDIGDMRCESQAAMLSDSSPKHRKIGPLQIVPMMSPSRSDRTRDDLLDG